MQKSIKLTGLSASPSDYSCSDGNLAAAINIVHDEGSIKSPRITAPKLKENLGSYVTALYQHKTNVSTNLVKYNSNSKKYYYTNEAHKYDTLDIVLEVKGRIKNTSKTYVTINDGDIVDLSAYDPDDYDFDVFVKPRLILNGNDISGDAEKAYYSRKRTGKDEKVDIDVSDIISSSTNEMYLFEPMSTSSLSEMGSSGEFCMIFSIEYKGNIVSKTFNFKYIVDEGEDVPSQITPYTGNVPLQINSLMEFSDLSGKNVTAVTNVKNIIIFLTDENKYYYLYSNNVYLFLGNSLPELDMSFSLDGHTFQTHGDFSTDGGVYDKFQIKSKIYESYPEYCTEIKYNNVDTDKDLAKEAMDGALVEAELFTNVTSKDGYFTQPFFVRFAYRLYDETNTKISAPMLVVPSMHNPCIYFQLTNSYSKRAWASAYGIACKLRYFIHNERLDLWSDIIKGIDIFVSRPIYTFKQSDADFQYCRYNLEGTADIPVVDFHSMGIFKSGTGIPKFTTDLCVISNEITDSTKSAMETSTLHPESVTSGREGWSFYDGDTSGDIIMKKEPFTEGSTTYHICYNNGYFNNSLGFGLEQISDEDFLNELEKHSDFYLVSYIKMKDIDYSTDGHIVDIEESVLTDVSTNQALTEDYDAHNTIIPRSILTYNDRLSEFNIKRQYFEGFKFENMVQLQQIDDTLFMSEVVAAVYIKNKGETIVRCTKSSVKYATASSRFCYIYYPNTDAFQIDLFVNVSGSIYKLSNELDKHPMLNGSYCYVPLFSYAQMEETEYSSLDEVISSLSTSKDYSIDENEIRTSDTDNPFVFKAANVETIGNGRIIALVPQAIALSQGQFGEYPMMCFTTDGIWALSVNSTGGWSAKQPFSRDVVLNEDAGNILQLDRQVMFASNRGLMLISGSNVDCISEVFDGFKDTFKLYDDESVDDGYESLFDYIIGNQAISDITTTRDDVMTASDINHRFLDFISDAVFLYDYTHQRIIIGNQAYPYAYVFNMKDKLWTAINQRISSSVNSYPNCYAMTKVGQVGNYENLLVDFSATDGNASQVGLPSTGFILTRPIKLDAPDVLKTVSLVVARGNMARSSVDLILLASRDLTNWVIIKAVQGNRLSLTHGTAYRYFRVGIVTHLASGESLDSLDIQYDVKQDNKIR